MLPNALIKTGSLADTFAPRYIVAFDVIASEYQYNAGTYTSRNWREKGKNAKIKQNHDKRINLWWYLTVILDSVLFSDFCIRFLTSFVTCFIHFLLPSSLINSYKLLSVIITNVFLIYCLSEAFANNFEVFMSS